MWGKKLPVLISFRKAAFPCSVQGSDRRRRVAAGDEVRAGYQEKRAGFGMLSHVMNLDEYMVTLDKPIGIRFAQTLTGQVFVEALASKVHISLSSASTLLTLRSC